MNLDEDNFFWADMEEYCQEHFEDMFEPDTLMDPINVDFKIGDKDV